MKSTLRPSKKVNRDRPTTRSARQEDSSPPGRRYVALLMADICGSSQHAELYEHEDYASILAAFRSKAREIVSRFGGVVARFQGDGLLAVFGIPTSRETDGERAVRAALALRDAFRDLEGADNDRYPRPLLSLHSGVHYGLALIEDGDIERGRVDVVGEAPNTAARLCSMAGPGEICASVPTLGPRLSRFLATPIGLSEIRGRDKPLALVLVHAANGPYVEAMQSSRHPAVGRVAELQRLCEAAASARDRPLVFIVAGAPGAGKSCLLREFAASLDPRLWRLLQGAGDETPGAPPLQPFAAVVGQLSAHAAAAEPSVQSVVAAILAAVEADAGRELLFVLDDWHWADDASHQALDMMVRGLRRGLILIAMRSDAEETLTQHGAERLELTPLAAKDVEALVLQRLPQADPFVVQAIVRDAGGVPLFAEELCNVASATASTAWLAPSRPDPAGWLGGLVASRVGQLLPREVHVLQTAAVLGTSMPDWLLERLTGCGPGSPELRTLVEQDFLVVDPANGSLAFRHSLTRDAIAMVVGAAARCDVHRKAYDALSAPEVADRAPVELMAYHAAGAGLGPRAAELAEAAGDKAMTMAALDRARLHFINALRGLAAIPGTPEADPLRWVAVTHKLGLACIFDPLDLQDGMPLFERAAVLARGTGSEAAQARSEYWLGYLHYARGRPRRALVHGERALALAITVGDDRLAVQARATLGEILVTAGDYARAQPLLEQAIAVKRRRSAAQGIAVGSAYALARQGFMLADIGQANQSHACFDEARALLGTAVHPVAASITDIEAAALLWSGRWQEAREAARRGEALALGCRSRYLLAMARGLEACAAWALDDDGPAAHRRLRDASSWIEQRGGGASTSLTYGWLVEMDIAAGDCVAARAQAARLLLRARWGDDHGLAIGCRALARDAAATGAPVRAGHYLRLADAAASRRGSPREAAANRSCRTTLGL